ncbi:MAG: phosphoribosylglycinamide formyltransferase [Deltaproteobacteria bacterium]|nr:MAG: phosphoribosylglycinamide formyltransferase [Deltaproteobacteria bacterium]
MLKLAVLLSGSGRTLDNFHECSEKGSLRAQVEVVVSNVADALGLEKARKYGYPSFFATDNATINGILSEYSVDIVCLAGYLKLFVPTKAFERRVINIHPSLIPAFCGKGFYGHHVHSAVQKRGCTVTGCTVHFANGDYDEGPIILQRCLELDYEDDPETIAAKVFAVECQAFPDALNMVEERGVDFFWQRFEQNAF